MLGLPIPKVSSRHWGGWGGPCYGQGEGGMDGWMDGGSQALQPPHAPVLVAAASSSGGSHSAGRRKESVCTCICITYAFLYLLYIHRAACRYKHRRAFWISYLYQQCCGCIKYCTSAMTNGVRLHLQTCSELFVNYLPIQPAHKYNPLR